MRGESYSAGEAGEDALLRQDTRFVETALSDRVAFAVKCEHDGIANGRVEGIRRIDQALLARFVLPDIHIVADGQGQWEHGHRKNGGDMHDDQQC
jgi:hypothetical protein